MKLLLFLLRRSRGIVLLAVLAGVVSGLCSVGLLRLIHQTLEHARKNSMPATSAWLFVALCLGVLVARIVSQTLLINLSRRNISRLCRHLSERILATPLRQLEEIGSARLLATLTSDIPTVSQAFTGLPVLFINLAILAGCLAYLAWLSLPVLLVVAALLGLGIASHRILARAARRYLEIAREEQDTLLGHFRSLVDGVKELKVHQPRRQAFLERWLHATVDAVQRYNTIGQMGFTVANSWGRLLFFVLLGVLLFVLPDVQAIDPVTLSGFTLAILFLLSPLEGFMTQLPMMARARVALKKIEALGLSLSVAGKEEIRTAPPADPAWQCLELAGVTHAYSREREGDGFTLGPIDLVLRPGELVFLVGGNGSGKTTLAKLLVGLYVPEQGEIRLDGQPISAANRESYRQYFSVVFADIYLFESFLGLEGKELDQQARQYLVSLRLDHEVRVEDGVLSTTDLSRGQRKRLALLTAWLEDRPIYVFDEWASDQDPQFKKVFYTEILPALKARGKAVLAITHDERYFHLADRVLHLEDGQFTPLPWELPAGVGSQESEQGAPS
jgi:putative ATP-binding cassette transporter